MLWRIVRADRRGWLHRVIVAPDALTVHVKGTELAGAQVELATRDNRQIRPVGTTARLRFWLPRGLAPATIVMLRSGDDWLDFRYFPAPGPGGDTDGSVIWDLPGADASVLIAGGESQYVEFKEQLPVSEHRRKMLKTVAAFASGEGGTVLIGVTDDSQIVGVDATKLDELMLTLHNMIRSNIDPDPGATVAPGSGGRQNGAAGRGSRRQRLACIQPGEARVLPAPGRQHRPGAADGDHQPLRPATDPAVVAAPGRDKDNTPSKRRQREGLGADPCRQCRAGRGTTGRLARPPRAARSR
jgi:hypothetical protein